MNSLTLSDLEAKLAAGEAFHRADAERVAACTDLVTIGMLGEQARKARHGSRVTFARVCVLAEADWPIDRGEAGEVRLIGAVGAIDDARARVRAAARFAAGVPLTGFSVADLLESVGGDHLALADAARALRQEGLEAIAEVPLDRLGDTDNAAEVVRAVRHGGLNAWRATLSHAPAEARLDLIERAAGVQQQTGAFRVKQDSQFIKSIISRC